MSTTRLINPVAAPEMKDILNRTKQDIAYNLNCVQIGTIVSYNASKNTAQVKINFQRQLPSNEIVDYPLLQDAPVFYLSGSSSFISMPISAGDTCLILFNDRDIDTWWLTGETNVPASDRAHSLSDALVLVGVRPQAKPLAVDATNVMINAGVSKVVIKNEITDLKILIDSLIDAIKAIIIQSGAVSPASQIALTLIQQQFHTLLA